MKGIGKLIIIPVICVFGMHWGNAQDNPTANIKLRDGSVIKKAQLKCIGDDQFLIPLSDGTSMHINRSEIKSIQFLQQPSAPKDTKYDTTHYYDADTRWYHELMAGGAFGAEGANFTLGHIHGYRYNKNLAGGLGLNYDRYGKISVLPVYADLRYYYKVDKLSAYYFGNIGYGFGTNTYDLPSNADVQSKQGGFMWHTGLGIQVNFNNTALAFKLGYKQQDTEISYNMPSFWGDELPDELTENRNHRRIVFTTSFMF